MHVAAKVMQTLVLVALPAMSQPGSLVVDKSCGDPMLESQLWEAVSGTFLSVAATGGIEVRLVGTGSKVTVHLAGIAPPKQPDAKAAFEQFVRDKSGDKALTVLMPSDWTFASVKPKDVTASIKLQDSSDLGLLVIENKLARFREPPPYKMSRALACQYRRSDQAANTSTAR